MTPEAAVKRRIKRLLDAAEQCWYCTPIGSMFGKAGVPDFVGVHKGAFFAVEAKAGAGKQTTLQAWVQTQIQHAGGWCEVIREDNQNVLADFLNRKK